MLCAGHRAWSSLPVAEPQEPQLPPFDHTPAPYEGPSREEVYALRKQYLSPGQPFRNMHVLPLTSTLVHAGVLIGCSCHHHCCVFVAALFHHFKQPIMITEGKMQYLYDERGRRYLDVRFRCPHQRACHDNACQLKDALYFTLGVLFCCCSADACLQVNH